MNARRRSSRRPNPNNGDVTTGSESGTDYQVNYSLSEFQRGSMVLRFPSPPSKNDLFAQLEKYGLNSSQISHISATPVASLRRHETAYEAQQGPVVVTSSPDGANMAYGYSAASNPLPQRSAKQQPSKNSDLGSGGHPKRRGCIRPILGILFIGFLAIGFLSTNSYSQGAVRSYSVSEDAGLFQSIGECSDLLDERVQSSLAIWGDDPKIYQDRVSSFALQPANASFMLGCVVG